MGDLVWSAPQVQYLYPDFRRLLRQAVVALEDRSVYRVKITQGLRTYAKQDELYAQGRTKPGKRVTSAKGGQSFHNFGVAADIAFFGKDPYLEHSDDGAAMWKMWGEIAVQEGLEWGGLWDAPKTDLPHVQLTYGFDHREMHALYIRGGIVSVWEAFDRARGVELGAEWRGLIPELQSHGLGKPK